MMEEEEVGGILNTRPIDLGEFWQNAIKGMSDEGFDKQIKELQNDMEADNQENLGRALMEQLKMMPQMQADGTTPTS